MWDKCTIFLILYFEYIYYRVKLYYDFSFDIFTIFCISKKKSRLNSFLKYIM